MYYLTSISKVNVARNEWLFTDDVKSEVIIIHEENSISILLYLKSTYLND